MAKDEKETGAASIRLGGMRIDELPIAESALVKPQIPLVEKTQRENEIETIKARYPKINLPYAKARIDECTHNIDRVNSTKGEHSIMISEYNGLISLCIHRDKEVEKLDVDDEQYKEKRRALFKQFPPYDVEAMQKQITQCEEAIERCDRVMDQERDSIAELKETIALINQRDREIAKVK